MDSMLAAGPAPAVDDDIDSRMDSICMAMPRRWREVETSSPVKPGERSGASSVTYQDGLYIFGGYGGSGRLEDIFRFDFPTRCWGKVEVQGTVPAGRENNGAVVHGNKMYLFGGYSGFTWLNDFHALDFDTRTWRAVPNGHKGAVPSTRFGYVSSVHGDLFFVFRDYDGATWLNDMYEFDLERGFWSNTQVQGFVPSGRSCP